MAAYPRLVVPSDQERIVEAAVADTRTGSAIACFTVRVNNVGEPGISSGIGVEGEDRPRIFVGDEKFGGKQLSVGLEWSNMPAVAEGKILKAYLEARRMNDGRPFWAISRERLEEADKRVLVKVETGHPSVLRSKIAMFVRIVQGNPEKIRAGTCRSRNGFENSFHEIWRLSAGDILMVQFVSGQVRNIRAGKGRIELLELPKVGSVKKPEPIGKSEWDQAMEAANTADTLEQKRVTRRDWGRYQMMNLASTPEQWQVVHDHLLANIKDVRTKVYEAFLRGCQDVGLLLSISKAWNTVPSNKEVVTAVGIPDVVPHDTGRKGPPASRVRLLNARRAEQAKNRKVSGGNPKKNGGKKEGKKNKKK